MVGRSNSVLNLQRFILGYFYTILRSKINLQSSAEGMRWCLRRGVQSDVQRARG